MTVRDVPPADYDQAAALAGEAFGTFDPEPWVATLAHTPAVGAYDGDRLVSFARVKPYVQWFGGRAVPMSGVASVAVTGSHQRRGLGRETVAATLPLMRERGLVVSALYPATTPLYRELGWEYAGDHTWLDLPGALLRDLGAVPDSLTVRPATDADVPAMHATYERHCAETNGLLGRTGPLFTAVPLPATVAEGPGGVEGFSRADRTNAGHDVDVRVRDVHATTPRAYRALWFALGAGSSTARTVRAKAFPDDVVPLLAEPAVTVHEHLRWMLRLVDAPAAVAARGWPAGLAAAVDLDVADPYVPDNEGRWRLAVEGGHGTLTRGGDGTVALGVGALSALYSGYADPRTFRRTGRLITTDEAALDTLATMTAGPRPRLLDYF